MIIEEQFYRILKIKLIIEGGEMAIYIIFVGVIFVLYICCYNYLISIITFVGVGLIGVVVIINVVISVMLAIGNLHKKSSRRYYLIIYTTVYIACALLISRYDVIPRLDFYLHRKTRNTVVKEIKQEMLLPDKNNVILLPEKFKNNIISQGNQLVLCEYKNKPAVYFYYNQGLLNESAGYIYLLEDNYQKYNTDIQFKDVISFGDGWYYCRTY